MSKIFDKIKERRFWTAAMLAAGIGLTALALFNLSVPATAAPSAAPASQGASNESCLGCHTREDFTIQMDSGETLSLTINPDVFGLSVHGQNEIACVACHTDISAFPHPDRKATSVREISLQYYTTCQQCHQEQYRNTLDSVHQTALAGGDTNAAICTDCHNPHQQPRLTDPDTGQLLEAARLHIPRTCEKCHSLIFQQYKQSVHGSALVGGANPDVPTCIDCHGVHNIEDPTTARFRINSPLICANCHTDSTIMDRYGISTNVLDTYVADFHGTTITLFEKQTPDQQSNKAVCFDCHGVHNIKRTNDPTHGISIKENMLVACQQCHPDATANFPDSWMSHYIPSQEKNQLVYYVNLFYLILIPGVIGGMLVFVLSDIVRRMVDRRKGSAHS